MQLKRYLFFILILASGLLVSSCASTRMAQELAGGKSAFQDGYYKEAFHKLLPLAVKGNPEAQYAVGYMYYYGYGAPEDTESGIFWMSKAAEQKYLLAMHALDLIHQHEVAGYAHENLRAPDERLQSVPIAAPPRATKQMSYSENPVNRPEPPVKLVSAEEDKPTPELSTTQIQAARNYTLQLYGSYHLAAVKNLQAQLRLKNTGHVYRTTHEGKDWYILTFGNFATAHEASATQRNLPSELKTLHPWVRKVDALAVV